MSGHRDMTIPNWKRTLAKLRRQAAELRKHDFQVIEPPNVDVAPDRRAGLERTPKL